VVVGAILRFVSSQFASDEARQFWGFISGSLDRLMGLVREQPEAVVRWTPIASDANSIFVLAQHTIGNAADNLLAVLGGQEMVRDRAAEFETSTTVTALVERWSELRPALESQMRSLGTAEFLAEFVHPRRGAISGLSILIVVARHAAEHLGQAELTRDLALAMNVE